MGLENSKRWHWALVALVVGPALAFMNLQAEPGSGLRSMSGTEFEREIALKEVPGGSPNLKDVVVHPPELGAYNKQVYVVTMQRAVYERQEKGWRYQPYALQAEAPYVSFGAGGRRAPKAGPVDPNRTIETVLKEIAAKDPGVKYRYAWWEEPKWAYSIWTGGALVVIGGIWPTVLGLLVGAGFGPKAKEEEYDLDRFKSSGQEEETAAKPEPKEMSAEDRERLQTQLEKLEKNIGTAAVMTGAPGATGGAPMVAGPAPIRQLNGGPVEMQAGVAKEEEDKEYKGEFYPVARAGGAKPQEPAGQSR